MKTTTQTIAILAMITMTTTITHAATIALTNDTFESPDIAAWTWNSPSLAGWTKNYGTYGVAPTSNNGGDQSVWNYVNKGWFQLSQNSSYTVGAAGEVITAFLDARITNLDSGSATINLKVLLNGTAAIQIQPSYTSNFDWTQISVSYTTTAADIGKTVGIAFGSDGGFLSTGGSYIYQDNASLTVVPEPSAALLGGIGAFALLRRRRMSRD